MVIICQVFFFYLPTAVLAQTSLLSMGNTVFAASRALDLSTPTVFLVDNPATGGGLLLGFSAYFLSYDPVVLQIWRPATAGNVSDSDLSTSYTLVFSTSFIAPYIFRPVEVDTRQLMAGCVQVQKGDALGVLFTSGKTVIAYTTSYSASALTLYLQRAGDLTHGVTALFDVFPFAFHFSILAYVYSWTESACTGSANCTSQPSPPVNCSANATLTSSPSLTITLPIDERQIAVLGSGVVPSTLQLTHSNPVTFLLRNAALSDGLLVFFSAYFAGYSPASFQIWRPQGSSNTLSFTLVFSLTYSPPRGAIYQHIEITARNAQNKYFRLLAGDRLGMTSTISPTAIAYVTNFVSPASLFVVGDRTYSIGDEVTFDALHVPYDFSLSAYIFVGNRSATTGSSATNSSSSVTHDNSTSTNSSTSGSGATGGGSSAGGVCYGTGDAAGYVDCPELDQIVFQTPTAAPADTPLSIPAVTQAPIEPTTTPPFVLIPIGNPVNPSNVQYPINHVTLLLVTSPPVPSAGILAGFSAYFLSSLPVELHIWRPTSSPDPGVLRFTLIFRLSYNASVFNQPITLDLTAMYAQCLVVQRGDVLGLLFNPGPTPIPYVTNFVSPATLQMRGVDSSSLAVGTTENFDPLLFPYDFSAGANIYMDSSWLTSHTIRNGFVACPSLKNVNCPLPPAVRYASFSLPRNDTSPGRKVTYTCQTGYFFPDGSTTFNSTCHRTGVWTPDIPAQCEKYLCPALTLSANLLPSVINRTVGAVITLTCAAGYDFTDGSGTKSVTCKNLQWVGDTTASCYAIWCSVFTLRYAQVDVTSPAVYGTAAVITCHIGYHLPDLTRTRTLVCVDGGAWTLPPQDCLPDVCTNVTAVPVPLQAGVALAVACSSHNAPTFDRVVCVSGGAWITDVSMCDLCDPSPLVTNTLVTVDTDAGTRTFTCLKGWASYDGSLTLTLVCDEGDDLIADNYICSQNVSITSGGVGLLFDQNNSTVLLACATPFFHFYPFSINSTDIADLKLDQIVPVNNASASIKNSAAGSTATITCLPSLLFITGDPSMTLTCDAFVDDDVIVSNCSVRCPPVYDLSHGSANTTITDIGTTVSYQCDEGHTFSDASRYKLVSCLSSATWSDTVSDCQLVQCHPIPAVTNAVVSLSKKQPVYGATATMTCITGYQLPAQHTVQTAVCLANGQWTSYVTDCFPMTCSVPTLVQYGQLSASAPRVTYNTSVSVTCFSGYSYDNSNSQTFVCGASGLMDPPFTDCSVLQCPPIPLWGAIQLLNNASASTAFGSTVQYRCGDGFTFIDVIGQATVRSSHCDINGTWSPPFAACASSSASVTTLTEGSGAPVIGLAFFFLTVAVVVAVLVCWDVATPLAKAMGRSGSPPHRTYRAPKRFLRSSPYSLKPNKMGSSFVRTSKSPGKAKAAPVYRYKPPLNRFRYFEYDVRVAEKMAFAEYVIVSTRF